MKNIKNILLFVLTILSCNVVFAQSFKTSYFMDKSPLNISMNPALRPQYGYINVPGIGGLGLTYFSNSLSADKLFFNTDKGLVTFLDSSVDADKFLSGLAENNTINLDANVSILGAGFYAGKNFWRINIGANVNANSNIPKSLFEFVKVGNGLEGKSFKIDNLNLYSTAYVDVALGYSREINKKWTVGGAVKFLIGAANAESYFDYMNIDAFDDKWKISSSGVMNVNMQGMTPKLKNANGKDYISGFDFGGFGIAGYGVAFDMGFTYRPIPDLVVSASLTDLGFISWSKNSNTYALAKGEFVFDGFDIPITDGDNPIEDQTTSLKDDLLNIFHFEPTAPKSNLKMVTATYSVAAEYSVLNNKIGFGALYTGRFAPTKYENELTIMTTFRPKHWFSASLSYSFLHSYFKTFGFALNFSPSWINFYVGTDYMFTHVSPQFIPIKQRAVNVHFGMSVPIGVRAYRNQKAKANDLQYSVYSF